jgi:hypothetical protein
MPLASNGTYVPQSISIFCVLDMQCIYAGLNYIVMFTRTKIMNHDHLLRGGKKKKKPFFNYTENRQYLLFSIEDEQLYIMVSIKGSYGFPSSPNQIDYLMFSL